MLHSGWWRARLPTGTLQELTDANSGSDPYCKCYVKGTGKTQYTTRTASGFSEHRWLRLQAVFITSLNTGCHRHSRMLAFSLLHVCRHVCVCVCVQEFPELQASKDLPLTSSPCLRRVINDKTDPEWNEHVVAGPQRYLGKLAKRVRSPDAPSRIFVTCSNFDLSTACSCRRLSKV